MDELKNSPSLKYVAIRRIEVFEKRVNPVMAAKMKPLDVDMEVLMKFVFFLSNEPFLQVGYTFNECPEGSTLFNFLQEMHFSQVNFVQYNAKYNRLLERQYSWRKATRIEVLNIASGGEFLEAELAAIRMKNCNISEFPSPCVLDAIVARFLEDPGQFGEDYEIDCYFEREKTKEILLKMKERTRFIREYANKKTGKTEFAVNRENRTEKSSP